MNLVFLLSLFGAGAFHGTATVSGVQAIASLGNEAASGTAVIAETGLGATASLGTVTATGTGTQTGGGGGGALWGHGGRRFHRESVSGYTAHHATEISVDAVAHVRGVRAVAQLGRVRARGTARVATTPLPPLVLTLAPGAAFGAKNLTNEEMVFLFYEAA